MIFPVGRKRVGQSLRKILVELIVELLMELFVMRMRAHNVQADTELLYKLAEHLIIRLVKLSE